MQAKLNPVLPSVGRQAPAEALLWAGQQHVTHLQWSHIAVLPLLSLEGGRGHCGKIPSKAPFVLALSRCNFR